MKITDIKLEVSRFLPPNVIAVYRPGMFEVVLFCTKCWEEISKTDVLRLVESYVNFTVPKHICREDKKR